MIEDILLRFGFDTTTAVLACRQNTLKIYITQGVPISVVVSLLASFLLTPFVGLFFGDKKTSIGFKLIFFATFAVCGLYYLSKCNVN